MFDVVHVAEMRRRRRRRLTGLIFCVHEEEECNWSVVIVISLRDEQTIESTNSKLFVVATYV